MFTVKYVTHEGVEYIRPADEVIYYKDKQSPQDFSGVDVFYKGEKSEYADKNDPIQQSKLYVMNEHGKTVATYTL